VIGKYEAIMESLLVGEKLKKLRIEAASVPFQPLQIPHEVTMGFVPSPHAEKVVPNHLNCNTAIQREDEILALSKYLTHVQDCEITVTL
jgi:hypothetical protein